MAMHKQGELDLLHCSTSADKHMLLLETTGTQFVARITSEDPDFLIDVDIDDHFGHVY